MIAGNHERAATGAISTDDFNPDAATSAQWTKKTLSPAEHGFLDALPEVSLQPDCTLVHGTLRDPIWEYMHSYEAASAHLRLQESPLGFFGHTHIPTLVTEDHRLPRGCELYRLQEGERIDVPADSKIVVNPGSVGQPRDGDPRSSCALYDTNDNAITLHRLEYDIGATQKLMEEAKLPRWLIERLAAGR